MDKRKTEFTEGLAKATGRIPFKLSNDVIFHCMAQRSNVALKGLICALLSKKEEEVRLVVLLNPVNFKDIISKEIILDVKVELNSEEIILVELQWYRDKDWENRSLLYLCRAFDELLQGQGYENIKPATLISIMNYSMFGESQEFYEKYELKNEKNDRRYTSNFGLNVLDCSKDDKANKEDIDLGRDIWARLFKAQTWEELRKLAALGPVYKEVAESVYASNMTKEERYLAEAHEKFLWQQQARFDYYRDLGLEEGREEGRKEGRELKYTS